MKHILRFDAEFAPGVQVGAKTSTIRSRRTDGRDPMPGDRAALYEEYGTPRQRLMLETIIDDVAAISILPFGDTATVIVGWHALSQEEADRLACADGFHGLRHMIEWFDARYGLPFFGNLINWAGPSYGPGYTH